MEFVHIPVLLHEVLDGLAIRRTAFMWTAPSAAPDTPRKLQNV